MQYANLGQSRIVQRAVIEVTFSAILLLFHPLLHKNIEQIFK
jgi:hypothetical protein